MAGPYTGGVSAVTSDSEGKTGHNEATSAQPPEREATEAQGLGGPERSKSSHGPRRFFRRRQRVTLLAAWVAGAVVLMAVGAALGVAVVRSQNNGTAAELDRVREELGVVKRALSNAEERNWSYYRENLGLKAQIEAGENGDPVQPSPTTTGSDRTTGGATNTGGVTTVYGDGIYLVGEDIMAGTYEGVVLGSQGYWARLKATDGMVSSILANAVPRGPFVLTINVSDKAVELRGVRLTSR